MTVPLLHRPVTASKTFSFYVGPRDRDLIAAASARADAVVIRGKDGPTAVAAMRARGFDGVTLFDREWWAATGRSIDARAWIASQVAADADRLLSPGAYVGWSSDDLSLALAPLARELELAQSLDAVPLIAVDSRVVGRVADRLASELASVPGGVALVLVDPGDPLAVKGGIQGLRYLSACVPELLLLRSDHGALGAVAFGARHASLGLITSHRHGTTPDRRGAAKQGDRTPRVFSLTYADWFTAATIAGWALSNPEWGYCRLGCCGGQDLSRFLDEDTRGEVVNHNLTSLAWLADHILDAEPEDQRSVFLEFCRDAAARYDLSGVRGPQDPKAQLTSWVLS